MTKITCQSCGASVNAEFPMHNCNPPKSDPLDKLLVSKVAKNITMEETGHENMLARVKATHRMVTALVDPWEDWTASGKEEDSRPRWLTSKSDVDFFDMMVRKFDIAKVEDIVISKKQFHWLRDIYDRSL